MKKLFLLYVSCSVILSTMLFAQGYSLKFNGTNNYVDCLSGGIGNNPSVITQEAWVKTNIVEAGPIMTKRHADDGSDWASLIVSTGKLRIYADDKATPNTDIPAPTTITDGKWHHVAGVRNNNTYIVYVDGVLDMTSTDNHVMGGSSYNFHIGHHGGWNGYFNGQIAEVRVWNRALTEAEIKSKMFSNLVPAQETGLVGYWKFNEGSGTTATDLAGTNNGIISGATWVSDRPSITNFGLVAYYPFFGNANDSSGNGNNGTVNGATLTTDRFGMANNAYYFSSASCATYIQANINTGSIQSGLTISVWVLRTSNGCIGPRIFEFGNGSPINGNAQWGWGNSNETVFGSVTSTGVWVTSTFIPKPNNTWTHLVYTNDSTTGRFYQDGVLINSVASTGKPILAGNVAFGRMNHPAYDAFNGKLDDIRIYNRALSTSEVQSLFNEGGYYVVPATPMNLLATAGNSQVILKWDKVADTDVKRYRIYQNTSSPAITRVDSTIAGNLNDTTKTITGLTNGQIYYFRITAVDSTGNESPFSNEVSAVPSTSVLPTAGLILYYPFNGNGNDTCGSGNNMLLLDSVKFGTDRFNNANECLEFNAQGKSYARSNTLITNVTDNFTISIWAYPKAFSVDGDSSVLLMPVHGLVNFGNGHAGVGIYMAKNGIKIHEHSDQYIRPAIKILQSFSGWQHVVVTYNQKIPKLYINGILIATGTSNNAYIYHPSTGDPYIPGEFWIPLYGGIGLYAVYNNNTGQWEYSNFYGKADDYRLYNRALSDAEIQSLYNEEQTGDTSTITTWRMQIQSQIASLSDIENFAGVSNNATDGQDVLFDKAEPPTSLGNYISLYFPHSEWNSILGNNFAKDIKKNIALADTVKRWYFQVQSNVINDTVILTFTNDRIPTSFGKYLTDLKIGKRVNLKNTSLYKYYNTSDTARSFILIIGDTTAPSLTLTTPNGSNIWRSGITKNITWSTNDGTGIDSIFVYSSSNSGTSYSLLKSLSLAQSTNWALPNEYLNNNYSIKISVRDSLGNQTTVKSAKTFTIVGDSLATSNNAGWSLISVPITPKDSSLSSIFDNASYLWAFTQSTLYKEPSAITLGTGYWLGVSATKNWFIKGIPNESDSSVQNLQLGYNIIGNSFVRKVLKSNLFFLKSGSYYSFSSAISAGLISNTLYGYSSSAYSSVDTMSLFGGYWIGVLQSGMQLIQKPNVSIVTPLAKQTQIYALNWELPIKLSTVTLADDIAMIGIKQNSTSGFDTQYDAPRPPRNPGSNYLEIYFTNTGGNYPAILGSKYAKDFRDSSSANWNFTIENSQNNDVTLSWDKTLLEGLAGSLQLNLKDNFNNTVVDMKQAGSYTFAYTTQRVFSINAKITRVGKNGENLPSEFSLSQNFPNPFNPTTTLRYGIPERSSVRLTVYNTIGQLVAQVYSGIKDVGYYEYSFDASRLSSGIYLYKIQAVSENNPSKTFVQTKKMVLMR